jgi:tryptophan-rich sensory protein
MTGIASRSQLRMSLLRYALVCVPLVLLLGSLSGAVSGGQADSAWFQALRKPPLMPPGWVFGVVWSILYVLLGLALAMLLHARGARKRARLIAIFILQLALNFAWSPTFFAFHRIDLALVLIAAMIILTIVLATALWPVRKLASSFLLVYLGWLMFAASLNEEILRLNGAGAVAPVARSTDIPL